MVSSHPPLVRLLPGRTSKSAMTGAAPNGGNVNTQQAASDDSKHLVSGVVSGAGLADALPVTGSRAGFTGAP